MSALVLAASLALGLRVNTPPPSGHVLSGVSIRGAGIVPYTILPGRGGVHFLLQRPLNGTRAGKLCDFGGRREAGDVDAYATAARECTEETGGVFGDANAMAEALRESWSVRILNPNGRYACFFHKVDYLEAERLPFVDDSPDSESVARECRWYRADELIGRVDESDILSRMITYDGSPFGDEDTAAQALTSFHKAVFSTLAVENANPMEQERWHSTVMDKITLKAKREAANKRAEAKLKADILAMSAAAVMVGKGLKVSSKPAANANAADKGLGSKRGSRRGPSKAGVSPKWHESSAAKGGSSRPKAARTTPPSSGQWTRRKSAKVLRQQPRQPEQKMELEMPLPIVRYNEYGQ